MSSIEQQYQNEIYELGQRNIRLKIVLEEVRELIDGYVDVVDGEDGQPRANKAMRAVQIIDEVL